MHAISHGEVIEYRQRIAKLNRLREDAQLEEMKLRRYDASLAKKYGCEVLKYRINLDTCEIEITPERVQYTVADSLNLVAMQMAEWDET
jgi:hypothetical protein